MHVKCTGSTTMSDTAWTVQLFLLPGLNQTGFELTWTLVTKVSARSRAFLFCLFFITSTGALKISEDVNFRFLFSIVSCKPAVLGTRQSSFVATFPAVAYIMQWVRLRENCDLSWWLWVELLREKPNSCWIVKSFPQPRGRMKPVSNNRLDCASGYQLRRATLPLDTTPLYRMLTSLSLPPSHKQSCSELIYSCIDRGSRGQWCFSAGNPKENIASVKKKTTTRAM